MCLALALIKPRLLRAGLGELSVGCAKGSPIEVNELQRSAGSGPGNRHCRTGGGGAWSAWWSVSGQLGVPSPTRGSTAERAPSVWSAFRVVGMVEAGGVEPPSRNRREPGVYVHSPLA